MIPTPHTIKILKSGGIDSWGDPIDGETIELKGNLRSQSKIVRNNEGQEVVSNYTVLFKGFEDIRHEDRIQFVEPNGEVKTIRPILIKFMRDLDGSVKFTKAVF